MGFTYQELKRIKKNSIVLEKQNNIEIQQNSAGFSKTESTFIREKFYSKPQNSTKSDKQQEERPRQKIPKHSADITTVLKRSLIEENNQQQKFEQRIHFTSDQLANLEDNINHEIEKLQEKCRVLLNNKKMETKQKQKHNRKTKCQFKEQGKTWAEHLAGNSCKQRIQDQFEIAKEKFSLQHKCICTSPRYNDDKDLTPRPRMRSVGSQITAREECLDQGAVGDYNSSLKLQLNSKNKLRNSKELLKECAQKDVPIITKNDYTVNCCYDTIEQPFCHYCANSNQVNGNICQHHLYQQIGANSNREYSYCRDEYNYYDCKNSGCHSQCARCYKAPPSTSDNRRQSTDLNTKYFYCRPAGRTYSPQCRCNKNTKRKTAGKNIREPSEVNMQCKMRESEHLQEQTNKRQSNKSKEANGKKEVPIKAENVVKLLSEAKVSQILKYFDRYIDDRQKELKLKECKATQNSDNSYSTAISIKLNKETMIRKKQQDSDNNTEFPAAGYDNVSVESQYSLQTLQMLKKMKIRAYQPKKPKEIIGENKQEKENNYKQYLEKYTKENESNKKTKQNLEEAYTTLRKQEIELPGIFKQQQAQNPEVDRESLLKEREVRASKDDSNFSHDQSSILDFASSDRRDTNNFANVENIPKAFKKPQSYEELRYECAETKRSSEAFEQFSQRNSGETYNKYLEDAKSDLEKQKLCAKDHNGPAKATTGRSKYYSDMYKESRDEKAAQTLTRYDANKARDSLEQGQPEKNLRQDSYEDKTCKESRGITKQTYSLHELQLEAIVNSQRIKGSIDYKSEIDKDSNDNAQYLMVSLRERGLHEAKGQHDHSSQREYKGETEKEKPPEYGCESGEKYDSLKGKKIISSVDYHPPNYTYFKAEDKQNGETPAKGDIEKARELERETLDSTESQRRQKHAEQLEQKEAKETEFERSPSQKVTEADCYTKQKKMAPILLDRKEETKLIKSSKPKETEVDNDAKQKEVYPLKEENENFLQEKPQKYDSKDLSELKQRSLSWTYNDFMQVMDQNLAIFAHRSSQTENNFISEQISKQTFTEEVNSDQIFQRPNTLEDALKYLENFLKSYHQTGKEEEQCLNSVTTAANDLVKKISSCKSLLTDQVLTISQESTKSSQDNSIYTLKEKTTQDTQYRDPESTPDSSNLQLKQPTKEEEDFAVLDGSSESTSQAKKEESLILNESNHEKLVGSSHGIEYIEPENINKELATNVFFDQESYSLLPQVDSQQLQTSETNQRYHECKEIQNSVATLEEFPNGQPIHYDLIYKQEYCYEPYMESKNPYKNMSSSSQQPVFNRNLMSSESILKPCRIMETPKEGSWDLETYRNATSVVSFGQKDYIKLRRGYTMNYSQAQELADQKVNENKETIITKDLHSISKESNIKLTETTTIQQPIYQDSQSERDSVVEYNQRNNSSFSYAAEMPAFKQCPCMWETYVQMMTNFYKGKQKQLIN